MKLPPSGLLYNPSSSEEIVMNSAETLAIYPSLRGQRVFVTGGATGIGAAIVAAFAEQGAQVAFVDIAESESAALAQRIAVGPGRKAWKEDPARGGPSLVMGDIGTHAHNLLRFITGLEVAEVAAEVGSIVPGRITHDFAGAMLRLGPEARGSFWVTQAAAGVENGLRIRVSGSLGSIEWCRKSRSSSSSSRWTHRRRCERPTVPVRCRWLRARHASWPVTLKGFTRRLPISTRTQPKPSPRGARGRWLIRWRGITPIHMMVCSAWPSWTA